MGQSASATPRIAEFDWLKMLALFLLIFVHSDLNVVFPEVVNPLKWFMVSCFFFISGFLAFNSFHTRRASIRLFFKTKILLLYIPFLIASLFYFAFQTVIARVQMDFLRLLSNITLLNIFDNLNTIYNWGFLWFIPYLLLFMLVFCFLEKYIKNVKIQVLLVLILWFFAILAWAYDATMKPGQLFSQYFLVFMIGVWLNKLEMYEKTLNFRTALVLVPLLALFSFDFSFLFNFDNATEALQSLLYSNGRSIILSLSAVLMVLIFLQKLKIPRNKFVESIAMASIFIYLLDPIFAYLLSNCVFGQPTIYYVAGTEFYLYLAARIFILLFLLPLLVKNIRSYIKKPKEAESQS
jgi:surface polysaccharide O-acyltransferase-like enzyme